MTTAAIAGWAAYLCVGLVMWAVLVWLDKRIRVCDILLIPVVAVGWLPVLVFCAAGYVVDNYETVVWEWGKK